MNIYYPRIILILLMISILPHKTNAHENIIINPETCQAALLSHEKALSTFFEAIGKNDRDKLLTFKDMNWDLQTSYQNGQILLHYAAMLGRVEIVHTLVSEIRIDVNVQYPANGLTALHYATLYTDPLSRIDTIYILIKLGADIDILDNSDHSASDYVEDKRISHFRYSKEQKVKATELTAPPYNIDMSTLARLLQVVDSTLNRWIRQHKTEHNIPIKNQQLFQDIKTRPVKALKDSVTQKQTAKQPGVFNYTVSNWLPPYKEKYNIRKKWQPYPQEVKNQAIKMFKSGMIAVRIAEKLEINTRTVSNWLPPYKEKHNIKTKRQPHPQEVKNKAIEMFKSGMITERIAEELEVPKQTASDWLHPYKEKYNIRKKWQPHPHEVKNKAIKMFKSGMIAVRIAEELEITTRTVSNWLYPYKEKHNRPRQKRRRYSKEQRSTVIKMFFEDHKTNAQISKNLKIPAGIISNWVNGHKIKNGLETKKTRTSYPPELKEEAIEMFIKDKMKVKEVTKALDIPEDNLLHWIRQHRKQQEEIETNSQKTDPSQKNQFIEIQPQPVNADTEVLQQSKTHKENIKNKDEWRLGRIIQSDNIYIEAIEEMSKGRNLRDVAKEFDIDEETLKLKYRNIQFQYK